MYKKTYILKRRSEIEQWISQNMSKAFMCKQLHCKPETLERYLTIMGIKYSGNKSGKGIKTDSKYIPANIYITKNCVKTHTLKQKLIRDGLKKECCEKCGLSKWLGKPIPLELHHINGDHYDNSLNNLQLLCPNCHAIEPNHRGAANKKQFDK